MFRNLKEFLLGTATLEVDKDGEVTSAELQLATAALLWEMAHADNEYQVAEQSQIIDALVREFRLNEGEAQALLQDAEAISGLKGNIDAFIQSINNSFSIEQKQRLLSMIWRVVTSDGKVEEIESAFTSQLRSKLGLTVEDWAKAIEMAMR